MRFPTIRLYEGEDNDIMAWLSELNRNKSDEIKRVVRAGLRAVSDNTQKSVTTPLNPVTTPPHSESLNLVTTSLNPESLIEAMRREIIPDIRQIIEAILEERNFDKTSDEESQDDMLDGYDFGGLMV